MNYTLNIGGRLLDLSQPQVMGILNVTPDSFYSDSRRQTEREIAEQANRIVTEGGSMIDIGACSTRPGSEPIPEQVEAERLRLALDTVRRELPYTIISVDTFRPTIARMAVEEFGANIINDVGANDGDDVAMQMYRTVARLRVPYILTSRAASMADMLMWFAREVQLLRDLGAKDIVLDPGFGFGKTLEQNYAILAEMDKLKVMGLPLLVGLSRKSMIYKPLGVTPREALNGTTVLNTIALMKGASILRVHDVKEAAECVKIIDYNIKD